MGGYFSYDIRFIDIDEWDEAMRLVYRTFMEFDAPMFNSEGVSNFREFIADNALKRMFESGGYQVIGAYHKLRLVGVIALRDNSHISLLFVEKEHHGKGVGRKLFDSLVDYVHIKLHGEKLTVYSSPYATGFYHKMGFKDISEQICEKGIIYTPMEYLIGE